MKLTREQFNELGYFYIDDLNINDDDQNFMFDIFNLLPDELKGEVLQWGFSESLTREHIFEYLINKIYGFSISEYYKQEIYKTKNQSNDYVLSKLIK